MALLILMQGLVPGVVFGDWPSSPLANLPVGIAANFQLNAQIVSDGAGGAIIAWVDQRDVGNDIYANRVLASGVVDPGWPVSGRAVCTAPAGQGSQQLLADGAGGAFIVWQDFRNGATDIFAHHVLPTGELDPLWPDDGLSVCAADSSQLLPQITSDSAGGAFLVWSDLRNGVDLDIYGHHLLGNGALDPGWPDGGLMLCAASGHQANPNLIADSAGGAIVAWGDQRSGASDVYAQRVLPNGTTDPAWPLGGVPVCTFAGAQQQPVLAPDGAGGAFAAWVDLRAGGPNIYSAHILSTGALDSNWPADGLGLCTATGDQTLAVIAAIGPGEAIVAWMDARGASLDIYAQRVNSAGAIFWTPDGQAACLANGDQRNPAVAPDGSGGAIVTWYDRRGSSADIYAQHFLASSAADWPANGVALSTAQGNQEIPRILADGSGGAIIVWQDSRSDYDIYAQRVQANGQLGGTVVGVTSLDDRDFELPRVYPNPSRGGALRVSFALADRNEAALEMFDVAGRRVAAKEVGSFGPGRHSTELVGGQPFRHGIYFLLLRQGTQVRSQRVAVVE